MAVFSVVIPIYNKEKNIEDTLKSALCQTFLDFEIIIVNDGSTDESEQKILSFDNDKIKYFKTLNNGVAAARNFGIAKANGAIIAFLDADDYWFPNHLQDLFELYNSFPDCGIYATSYQHYYAKNKIVLPVFFGIPQRSWQGIVPDFFKSSMVFRIAWTSAVAIEKKLFSTVGNFDETITLGEDLDLWIRMATSKKVAFSATISAQYRLNASNRISLSPTLSNRFPKLNQFDAQEKNDNSLKQFLDLYRLEFAIKHKIAGDLTTYRWYKNQINPKNVGLKSKLILNLPTSLLKQLYSFKKYLERKNILFSIYN